MFFSASVLRLQIIRIRKAVLWWYLLVLAALCVPIIAKLKWNIPSEHFMRDGLALIGAPFYTGLFSNIGVLLWCSAAVICLFSGAMLRRVSTELFSYWTSAGALTLALLLDDLFLFHEVVYPNYLGLPETLVYALYGTAFLTYLLRFRKTILQTDFLLLLLALGFFAASLLVDALDGIVVIRGFYVLEDGLKLFGIVTWVLYFTRTARDQLAAQLRANRMPLDVRNILQEKS